MILWILILALAGAPAFHVTSGWGLTLIGSFLFSTALNAGRENRLKEVERKTARL